MEKIRYQIMVFFIFCKFLVLGDFDQVISDWKLERIKKVKHAIPEEKPK